MTETMPDEQSEQLGTVEVPRRPRKSIWRLGIPAVAAIALYYTAMSWSAPSFGDWEVDFDSATAKATATNRNVLAAFYLEGCPPCAMMDRFVLNKREVKRALQDYVPVRLNAAAQAELSMRYQVFGTPTFLVATPAGEVLARCEGYQSVDDFLAFLGRASAKNLSE